MEKVILFLMLTAMTAFSGVQAQQQQVQHLQDQEKKEIDKSQLPEQVKENFENSKYSNMQIVAIYEVKDKKAINLEETEPLYSDEAKRQHMRKTEKINELYAEEGEQQEESISPAPRSSAKARAERPNNDMATDEKDSRTGKKREQRDKNHIDQQSYNKKYAMEVEGDHRKYILVYSEEGVLEQATEESI